MLRTNGTNETFRSSRKRPDGSSVFVTRTLGGLDLAWRMGGWDEDADGFNGFGGGEVERGIIVYMCAHVCMRVVCTCV